MFRKLNNFFKDYGHVLQTISIVVAAAAVTMASLVITQNIREISKASKKETFEVVNNHKQKLNEMFLNNPTLRQALFGGRLTEKDMLNFIMLNDYENMFELWEKEVLDKSTWTRAEEIINNTLVAGERKNCELYFFWANNRNNYSESFNDFIVTAVSNAELENKDTCRPAQSPNNN
jgi:uncharacterized protein YqgQ